eukprot:TRINITY_DN18020_c0_g1_i4.p2 TRINITY_DN18020_c0_g1~~TRINITY_DN18020_c0_g1_i4.p2  ORF type:complete len:141 (-),score=21.67 TRINITY_DN18020_c0_g1_i4:192-614(-)
MKDVTCEVIVLEIGQQTQVGDKRVRDVYVADESASVNASIWGEVGSKLCPADIIRISGGVARIHKDALTLSVPDEAAVAHVGEFTKLCTEVPNMSVLQWTVEPNSDGPVKRWMVRQPKLSMLMQLTPSQREVYASAFPEE